MVIHSVEHGNEHVLIDVLLDNTVQFFQTVARQLGIAVGIHAEFDHSHGNRSGNPFADDIRYGETEHTMILK